MPRRYFQPGCDHEGEGTLVGEETCRHCGIRNEFAGWHLGMHEAMAQYQYVYGLRPIGPHRTLAHELLGSKRTLCPTCSDEGIITLDRTHWKRCSVCEATGGFWTVPEHEVERLRQRVLAEFPGMGVARPTSHFLGAVVHNLATGEMIGAADCAAPHSFAPPTHSRKPLGRLLSADEETAPESIEDWLGRIVENGTTVWSLEWDSGAPGTGAGTEAVSRRGWIYVYTSTDWGIQGPYPSLAETLRQHPELRATSSATTSVTSSELDAAKIAALLEPVEPGHVILVNGAPWRSTGAGWLPADT